MSNLLDAFFDDWLSPVPPMSWIEKQCRAAAWQKIETIGEELYVADDGDRSIIEKVATTAGLLRELLALYPILRSELNPLVDHLEKAQGQLHILERALENTRPWDDYGPCDVGPSGMLCEILNDLCKRIKAFREERHASPRS